jgi:mediator of RNA polymerase II transcription subunit 6
LESSLDILRKYKPDYTPRTGFAWPIEDPMDKAGSGGEASKKQTDDSAAGAAISGEPLPDADPDLIKKLEKERASTHPKKQQNTALLLNAMRTTAAHPFRTFHEREAEVAAAAASTAVASTAGAGVGAPSEVVASDAQRSSATPAPPLMPSQSTGSQSSYGPSMSQDPTKGAVGAVKQKKKKRMYFGGVRISLMPS